MATTKTRVRSVQQIINEVAFLADKREANPRYIPEPVTFYDELDALEMTSSACAIPARWND